MAQQLVSASLSLQADERFRGLWASLFYTPPPAPRIVMVCSPTHGEGASTVAVATALAGGEGMLTSSAHAADTSPGRVVLVDFNLRSSAVDKKLKLLAGPGLSDILAGGIELSDTLRRVGPGLLDVVTAGTQGGQLLELLRVDRVRGLFKELAERYEHIVIDAAPVNHYPDAQVLAELVDGIALVAHCRRTSREALLLARKRLEAGRGKILGVVLNMRPCPIPRFA